MFNRHTIVKNVKRVLFPFGEPYNFGGKKLRFKVGSRPIRRKYLTSSNDIDRNDVLQINYLEENFKDNDILWDIGSHHGHYSIFAASKVAGDNQVFSFEPNPAARKVQQRNIRLNNFGKKISLAPIALSNHNGYETFEFDGGNANAHIVKGAVAGARYAQVECKTVSALLDKLPAPTIVKIDTEGAEIDILREAGTLLADRRVRFICELHPFAWLSFNVSLDDLLSILNKYERQITPIDPQKSVADLPYYGTVLF